ncbi:MAG: Holliday junction resolvase RuvX [Phycisphaerales bacterium]|nr:Holliday junction resolvase RuvX [Phycisphaerales bacterium]
MTTRYVGIDFGEKRIGLAVGDDGGAIATPIGMIAAAGDDAGRVRDVILAAQSYAPDEWVVGLPLNMDGTEGPQARRVKIFAQLLGERTGQPVHLHDERLSSFEADQHMARTGLTHKQKKRRRDTLAAHAILQSFLDGQRRGS